MSAIRIIVQVLEDYELPLAYNQFSNTWQVVPF